MLLADSSINTVRFLFFGTDAHFLLVYPLNETCLLFCDSNSSLSKFLTVDSFFCTLTRMLTICHGSRRNDRVAFLFKAKIQQ
jgi:hypothetical protein